MGEWYKTQKELPEFYVAANSIVGKVGKSTDTTYSVTGEGYMEFAYIFNDLRGVKDIFLKWIESYKYFITYGSPPVFSGIYSEDPVIYWRIQPTLAEYEDHMSIYARLLISYLGEKK